MSERRRKLQVGLEDLLEGNSPLPREKEKSQTFRRRTNVDLQKSLKLLDDAVSPAFPAPVLSRTPRKSLLNYSSYTPRKVATGTTFDISDFIFTPSHHVANATEGSLVSALETPSKSVSLPVEMTEDLTTTNITVLMENDPGLTASVGLYSDFDQCMQRNLAPHQILDLLADYESACTDQVMVLRKLVKRVRREQHKFQKTYSTLDLIDKERSTWQLIRSLFKDRIETETTHASLVEEEDMIIDSKYRRVELSEQEIVSKLFEKDAALRQCQLVVDWLESCAREDLEEIADNVKFFSDQPVVWENTLCQLQSRKKGTTTVLERPLVDQMDPDAPVRQKRFLDDLDKEDEQRLLQHVFMCLRAGQLDKAQELCQSCGQMWRAATLEGWRLFNDPNYHHLQGSIKQIVGNPNRDVWKQVCWRLALEGKYSPFETAIYAVLSGNVKSLLPVCQSWYDCLWAYFRCLVDVRVEQEIRSKSVTFRKPVELPVQYLDTVTEPSKVFEELGASKTEHIRAACQQWYHVIQKHIILSDTPGLIEIIYNWVRKDRVNLPQHLIRFVAHLVLLLRRIDQECREELCTSVLEVYVQQLIDSGQKQLVAHYVATLPPPLQVQWYAHFLEGIKIQEERQMCLKWAEESDLDVAAITKTVVENIRNRNVPSLDVCLSMPMSTAISEEDRLKIDAIDWLVFDPLQRQEALKQANALMRSFTVIKKHNAAREVFNKLPSDSINVIYKIWHAKTGTTILPISDSNAVREYMCMVAYLDAVESFNDWFSLYHHGKPVKPSGLVGGSFTDRVAQEHRQKQYEMEVERWKHNLVRQTRTTKDRIYNVLLFTNGGWMVDMYELLLIFGLVRGATLLVDLRGGGFVSLFTPGALLMAKLDPEEEESRKHDMAMLRRLHIPTLTMNLHHVLHASGLYSECLQLADYIASEHYQLYKEFTKDDLKQLLRHLRESSLCLLDDNKDPIGYELV